MPVTPADVRARKARIRPPVTWAEIAAETKGPDGAPYSEGYVSLAVNGHKPYSDRVIEEVNRALAKIETRRAVAATGRGGAVAE